MNKGDSMRGYIAGQGRGGRALTRGGAVLVVVALLGAAQAQAAGPNHAALAACNAPKPMT